MGIVIGGGQKSGTTQAIILLVLEIAMALVTSIWLPWGEGASMGATSFVFCVLRIITLVLVLSVAQSSSSFKYHELTHKRSSSSPSGSFPKL